MKNALTLEVLEDDPLGVLASTAPVAARMTSVRIDQDAVRRFARRNRNHAAPDPGEDALHCTFLKPPEFFNYLLLLEALNFCFWDDEPRWRVDWEGRLYDGYWALAAALLRGVRADGINLWEAEWMARVSPAQMAQLLRGEGRPAPMMAQRLAHVREAGRVLLADWGGSFANVLAAAGGDAPALVGSIVEHFPSFRDEAEWNGKPVRFYKRAQILAADLARLGAGLPQARLERLNALTAFADYKVPQVLRGAKILVVAEPLAERIESREPLPPGSPDEVSIRAGTIWACQWIARVMGEQEPERAITAADVDYLLWSAGQGATALPPYHRTRSSYY